MIGVEKRTGAVRAHLHQCAFGGISQKPTCFSGTLHGLIELNHITCPGLSDDHQHGVSIGPDGSGGFHTRRLQAYPSDLCEQLALRVIRTLQYMAYNQCGPTGALRQDDAMAAPRVTSWSTTGSAALAGITMLNEASSKSFSVCLHQQQSAVYVHVDDTVLISDVKAERLHSDALLAEVVQGLEGIGFEVSQQAKSCDMEKVVGYEIVKTPAMFRLPTRKQVLLRDALRELAGRPSVNINILRSLIGVWIFGALLRRELLSIPHSIFHFMDEFHGKTVVWWESARAEVRAMANLVCFMSCHVGSKWCPWLFATDSMGENEVDYGSYGICATALQPGEFEQLLKHGEAPGLAVARLDGTGGAK